MREMKAFASLSSGLLARKGAARPAMRPQLWTPPAVAEDDLGWNDMGDAAPVAAEPPADPVAPPPVVLQQQEIAREFAAPAPAEPVAPAIVSPVLPATAGRRVAFTLRLDRGRHLRLRLAAAAQHRSAQQIVTEALDAFLARTPEAERLAAALGEATRA